MWNKTVGWNGIYPFLWHTKKCFCCKSTWWANTCWKSAIRNHCSFHRKCSNFFKADVEQVIVNCNKKIIIALTRSRLEILYRNATLKDCQNEFIEASVWSPIFSKLKALLKINSRYIFFFYITYRFVQERRKTLRFPVPK